MVLNYGMHWTHNRRQCIHALNKWSGCIMWKNRPNALLYLGVTFVKFVYLQLLISVSLTITNVCGIVPLLELLFMTYAVIDYLYHLPKRFCYVDTLGTFLSWNDCYYLCTSRKPKIKCILIVLCMIGVGLDRFSSSHSFSSLKCKCVCACTVYCPQLLKTNN